MQKTKTILIEDRNRSFTVKELPVRVIWEILDGKAVGKNTVDKFQELLILGCPEMTKEAMLELYPSEIAAVWKGFEEVNADFLGVVRRIGLIDMLIDGLRPIMAEELRKGMAELSKASTGASAFSSSPGTAQQSGNTATASS